MHYLIAVNTLHFHGIHQIYQSPSNTYSFPLFRRARSVSFHTRTGNPPPVVLGAFELSHYAGSTAAETTSQNTRYRHSAALLRSRR